jgi:hypothetical protein
LSLHVSVNVIIIIIIIRRHRQHCKGTLTDGEFFIERLADLYAEKLFNSWETIRFSRSPLLYLVVLCIYMVNIVAYGHVVMRWLCIQWPLLSNGAVNTFLLLDNRFLIMQQLDYNSGEAVFSTWSVPRGHKREEVWSLIQRKYKVIKRTVVQVTKLSL